jgi:hypothetical protein
MDLNSVYAYMCAFPNGYAHIYFNSKNKQNSAIIDGGRVNYINLP